MNFYVGTSGYSYPEWKGSFYPAKMPAREMLGFYAARFRTVEINNTFYRPPVASTNHNGPSASLGLGGVRRHAGTRPAARAIRHAPSRQAQRHPPIRLTCLLRVPPNSLRT